MDLAPARLAKAAVVSAVTLALASSLSGCASPITIVGPVASPSPSPSASASPTPSPTPSEPPVEASPSPTPSPSASASAPWAPVAVGCLDLVSLDTMYQFDPNFALQPDASPAGGSPQATAASNGGVYCGWVQSTSGALIEISAASPDAAAVAELESRAGDPVGEGTYFSVVDGAGVVQVFTGGSWAVLSSSYFGSVADAQPLTDSVVAGLG
ncbi:arginyl-tRNA synthetase [Marisediminicola sp. LYQ134]|uniref:arginyl-tRNA synthetase n=1 Tax=unclassified Marisediminicola TaxID=2618316 RepID=UPI0039836174